MTDRKRDPLPEGYQYGDMGTPYERMSDEQKKVYVYERYIKPIGSTADAERHPVVEGEHVE